jgi:hypothetical protein
VVEDKEIGLPVGELVAEVAVGIIAQRNLPVPSGVEREQIETILAVTLALQLLDRSLFPTAGNRVRDDCINPSPAFKLTQPLSVEFLSIFG